MEEKSLFLATQKYASNKEITAESLLSRRYEQFLRSEKYCDCVFHVCGTFVRCHKLILCAASPVFEAMFFGPMHERQQQIDIADISAEIFQTFINYIYTGNVDYATLSLVQTIELFYTAEKYLLEALNADCLKAVKNKLRFANILPALDLCVRMDLDKLCEICLNFLQRCCLADQQQFKRHLQKNYVHISKAGIKALLANLKNDNVQLQRLMWFVSMWCQKECLETDSELLLDELKLVGNLTTIATTIATQGVLCERSYFKATRPFFVGDDYWGWDLQIKTNRFIRLLGIKMNSRLKPLCRAMRLQDEYTEEFFLQIRSISKDVDECDEDAGFFVPGASIWQHHVFEKEIKYNCDVNFSWEANGVVLSPDIVYELTLHWPESAYGAEYPCSLFSNMLDGIQVCDNNMLHTGSFIKGLRFSDLV